MDKKLLGRRINAARKERGWTSERLSEICNINATYLRRSSPVRKHQAYRCLWRCVRR